MNCYENSDLLNTLVEKAKSRVVVLGTHNGEFHADDLLATALLKHALGTRGISVRITRSRVKAVLDSCDIVYDVGGGIYDHHDINKVYYPNGIPMAACGKLLKDLVTDEDVAEGLRRRLFYSVEANDNGFELPRYVEQSRLYFVSMFNPTWMESGSSAQHKAFFEVLNIVLRVYERMLETVMADIQARRFISQNAKFVFDNQVMLLSKYCPVQEYARVHPELLAAVYPRDDKYVVRCMPTFMRKYATKVSFPVSWHGKSGSDLELITGIKGSVFCPDGGYMAVFDNPYSARSACDILLKQKATTDLLVNQMSEEISEEGQM